MTTTQDFINRLKYITENNNVAQWVAVIKLKTANKDLYTWLLEQTNFLQEKVKVTERIYCILHDIEKQPVCKMCGKIAKFRDYTFGYNTYCGPKCSANDPDSKEKKKATNRERYGSDYFLGTKECLEKTKITCQEKYGVDNIKQLDETTLKIRKTNLKNRGFEHHTQDPEFIKEQQARNLEKWGNINPMNCPEVLTKNKEKFGSEYFMCTDTFVSAKEEWLKENNVVNTSQIPEVREAIKASMWRNHNAEHHTQKYFTNMDRWTDVEYIKTEFIKGKRVDYTKAKLFFNASYPTLLYHFKNRLGLDIKNTNVDSEAEREIVHFIERTVPGIEIVQNTRQLLKYTKIHEDGREQKKYKEIDIYLPEYKLAIEYDGLYWHSIGTAGYKSTPHDIRRLRTSIRDKSRLLQEKGIRFLNIWENEWSNEIKYEIWRSILHSALGKSEVLSAKECQIVEVDRKTVHRFLQLNHIQGSCIGATHRFGLEFEGVLVAVMVFGRTGFTTNPECELLRYCTLLGYKVLGGPSALLKHFLSITDERSIVSYANRRYDNGSMLDSLGFIFQHTSNPNFYYFDPQVLPVKLLNKTDFQKNTLRDKLAIFDPDITEQQNMFANGYRAVYDAGTSVYKLTV